MLGAAVMVLITGYAAEALEDLAGELRAAGIAGRALPAASHGGGRGAPYAPLKTR